MTDEIKCSRVDTAIWMHYMDANRRYGEKVWPQLHKNSASNIEFVSFILDLLEACRGQTTKHSRTVNIDMISLQPFSF